MLTGVGLGAIASGAVKVTDSMFHAASLALVECLRSLDHNDIAQASSYFLSNSSHPFSGQMLPRSFGHQRGLTADCHCRCQCGLQRRSRLHSAPQGWQRQKLRGGANVLAKLRAHRPTRSFLLNNVQNPHSFKLRYRLAQHKRHSPIPDRNQKHSRSSFAAILRKRSCLKNEKFCEENGTAPIKFGCQWFFRRVTDNPALLTNF